MIIYRKKQDVAHLKVMFFMLQAAGGAALIKHSATCQPMANIGMAWKAGASLSVNPFLEEYNVMNDIFYIIFYEALPLMFLL